MAFKLPGFGGKKTNIKGDMDRKYGHGDFASKEKRMRPGESKFQYDVRMRKQGVKATDKSNVSKVAEIRGDLTNIETGEASTRLQLDMGYTPPVNPNDKRDQSKPQNFGIIAGMTFGEAFAKAGKGGARAGKDPFFWINPDLEKNPEQKETKFLYDFADKETKITPHLPKGF